MTSGWTLEWTCVGKIPGSSDICLLTHFKRTYLIQNQKSDNESDKICVKSGRWKFQRVTEDTVTWSRGEKCVSDNERFIEVC